jgi:AcrR family transcriptional regulator
LAGVSEPLIFRNFGSKAQLFQAAVADPMQELFADYLEIWKSREPTLENATQRMHVYVETLYDHLRAHKLLLRALILSTQSNDPELAQLMHRPDAPIIHYLDELARMGKSSLPEVGWTGINANIAVRITFGFILSLAIFDDLFFAKGKQPGRRALVNEMTAYVTHGLAHRQS